MFPCIQGICGEMACFLVYKELMVEGHVSMSTGNWWCIQGIGGERACFHVYRVLVVKGHVFLYAGDWW